MYEFKLLLENRSIQILAYNLETILAEKLETIITRGDQNTRPRDYYDVFILHKLQEKNIHYGSLKLALSATAKKRNSSGIIKNYKTILDVVTHSDTMQKYWLRYQKDFDYAHEIGFADTCDAVREIMGFIVEG